MITEQELQIEQLQKTLGKSGFLTYNITELNDIFDERETQRMILALESVTSDDTLEPIDYSRAQIDEALETESEIEFVKPPNAAWCEIASTPSNAFFTSS